MRLMPRWTPSWACAPQKPLQSETERERCKFEGVSAPIWTKAKSRL